MKDYEEKINIFNDYMNRLCGGKNVIDYNVIKKELYNLKYENQKLFDCIENKIKSNNNFRTDMISNVNCLSNKYSKEKELNKLLNCVKKLIRISSNEKNNIISKISNEEHNVIKELKDIMNDYEKIKINKNLSYK